MLVIGQKQVDRVTLPIKDDKVFYEEVISVEGLKATDIYFQAHKWLAEKFVDSGDHFACMQRAGRIASAACN